ncbi:helix-turn-helix domain-containing protein [Accumulibacter sp.]|uniref:helix-turn-helix domain-containing protein n=1 Tax=Betaproteobacteria TaxID=28216 RepID=UPI00261A9AFE|nr:helix-turn-helix domain-containing protein [Accumulibacter sp.]MBK8358661.1 helix-turn-helix domain-containing protein [Comamonadaceae bacterium]
MAKTIAPLLPPTNELLLRFGERLRLARRRRRLTAKQMAERAGMAPMTLRSLERGGSGVTMGAYLAVMQVLGIEKDMDLLGAADLLGRELQDARLTTQGKPTVRTESSASGAPLKRRRTITAADAARDRPAPAKTIKARPQLLKSTGQWVQKSGFISAQTLVDLIDAKGTTPKKMR